jgi:hypothetical protein
MAFGTRSESLARPDGWSDLIAAGRAFHAALADVAVPRWVGRGRNWWAIAGRVAWGEAQADIARGSLPGHADACAWERAMASVTALVFPCSQLRCWMMRSMRQPSAVRSMWLV